MPDYRSFLDSKTTATPCSGVSPGPIHDKLYDFQRAIVRWAVKRGRAAIFADCGLGKTFMQIEWARQVSDRSLIVAPLGVTRQTIDEGRKIGTAIRYVTEPSKESGIEITNYERLPRFVDAGYDAIVLDESSILKSMDGRTRSLILSEFVSIPHRLACTATPAPNDTTELGNHAEFLGIMSNREMSASFFVKDSNSMRWRLKGHATTAFYEWLATWCVYIRGPEDIGFDGSAFVLPPLTVRDVSVHSDYTPPGHLFPGTIDGIQGRIRARRHTEDARIAALCDEIGGADDFWIVWCGLNSEGRKLHRELNGRSVLVEGSMSEDEKASATALWISGERPVLITKPSIYGFGMNFQHCHRIAFLGLGDSYEQYYQAIRRCWRFGQDHPVDAIVVTSDAEEHIVENVKGKESQARDLAAGVVENLREFETREVSGAARNTADLKTADASGAEWRMMLGDSAERLTEIADESVGLSVFSPPFVSLYTYTATPRDLGNSKDEATFFRHFRFIIDQLLRATMPGRNCCVHVAQVPAMLVRDGYIGMKDFRAQTVAAFSHAGWVYHGECVIDKDPQAQAIRTKSKGLLFVQLKKDASWLRPALADYILVFRKPGDNSEPIKPDLTNEEWISWARPIWYGIRESDTLQFRDVRTEKDERHICPLQLGTIERCVRLWSNPGDLVLSPFAGIGSEGVVAVQHGRRFAGCELKTEYYERAILNLKDASSASRGLFD